MNDELDDQAQYLLRLKARIGQYLDRIHSGEKDKESASLELLASIFSAYEGGISNKDLSSAYPVSAWQNDQVLIPRALIRVIAEGWLQYHESEGQITLDQAFGLAGSGQGKSGTARKSATLDKEIYLSNAVLAEWKQAEVDGRPISQDAAIQAVFEREKALAPNGQRSPRYGTIRKAFQKHGAVTWDRYLANKVKG